MIQNGYVELLVYLIVLFLLFKPLGIYIARVYENKSVFLSIVMSPLEQFIYRISGIDSTHEMGWKTYLSSMLIFNFVSIIALYLLIRFQYFLPFNPQLFSSVSPEIAFNSAISFVTNTNWQVNAGENSLSYFTQMFGLTVQNFLSAATGMSILAAFIRGLIRSESNNLGNYWVDMIRSVLYILLPLAIILSIILLSQGVIQNFHPYEKIHVLSAMQEQIIPGGPVASQEAIKQLGTNGGGFFNVNSAHPFENPTPVSNFCEMLAILLLPSALCYTLGVMVNDRRQGWSIFFAMLIVFVPAVLLTMHFESNGNPLINQLGIVGGNMEGKDTRIGINESALWSTATTATANGSTNSMLDSYTPLGGFIPLWMMHLGEVFFGGVGAGLYGMLILVIITVFVAGLMVGRTPEYLGKKIEPYEMKMASFIVLLMPMTVLILTAVASITAFGTSQIKNPGPHGFSEMLYAITSMGNNNGSSFAGLNANNFFYVVIGGVEMMMIRFWIAIPTLAIAGSLARKKTIPASLGTLSTNQLLFIFLLIFITLIIGALTFFPALALGPIVEHFILWEKV